MPGQPAFWFFAAALGKASLVKRMPVFIGLAAFNINPLPQIGQMRTKKGPVVVIRNRGNGTGGE
jgi:hypothetical protein